MNGRVASAKSVGIDPQRHRQANLRCDAQCGTRPGQFNDRDELGGLFPIINEGHGERLAG
jgi:hypothetical protein